MSLSSEYYGSYNYYPLFIITFYTRLRPWSNFVGSKYSTSTLEREYVETVQKREGKG
jgi:hypothetical protein